MFVYNTNSPNARCSRSHRLEAKYKDRLILILARQVSHLYPNPGGGISNIQSNGVCFYFVFFNTLQPMSRMKLNH